MSETTPFSAQSPPDPPPKPTDTTEEAKHTPEEIPEDGGTALMAFSAASIATGGTLLGAAWVQECLQLLLACLGTLQLVLGLILLVLVSKRTVLFSRKQPTPIPEDDGEG